jgi:hypothetical protein
MLNTVHNKNTRCCRNTRLIQTSLRVEVKRSKKASQVKWYLNWDPRDLRIQFRKVRWRDGMSWAWNVGTWQCHEVQFGMSEKSVTSEESEKDKAGKVRTKFRTVAVTWRVTIPPSGDLASESREGHARGYSADSRVKWGRRKCKTPSRGCGKFKGDNGENWIGSSEDGDMG